MLDQTTTAALPSDRVHSTHGRVSSAIKRDPDPTPRQRKNPHHVRAATDETMAVAQIAHHPAQRHLDADPPPPGYRQTPQRSHAASGRRPPRPRTRSQPPTPGWHRSDASRPDRRDPPPPTHTSPPGSPPPGPPTVPRPPAPHADPRSSPRHATHPRLLQTTAHDHHLLDCPLDHHQRSSRQLPGHSSCMHLPRSRDESELM
jgi:hypothetical protein